ncbi:metallo-beta-lactamase superfamily protein [Umbelopsis sp. AD052]|nr:metallo-beta-lactamase superfamily protein [Umbelopsis sp. AD052]
MAATKAVEAGFTNVYNLEGGLAAWKAEYPLQSFKNNHSPTVHTILDPATDTAQYIVTDEDTRETLLIDPVLDYDPFSGTVKADTAKQLIEFVQKYHLNVTKIIDTHVHADHLSAGNYLHQHLAHKPPFLIGNNVTKVQTVFRDKYNFEPRDLPTTGEQFSQLVGDGTEWTLGKDIRCKAIATPGHTPACMSWLIGDALFAGDTLFMPDIGTARCDFPGGSAEQMYKSIHTLYDTLLDDTRVFVGHDYPSERPYAFVTFLEAHKRNNKMINEKVGLEHYIKARKRRDDQLKAPRYLHPSLQTNLRGGDLPVAERRTGEIDKEAGRFFKIPVRFIE